MRPVIELAGRVAIVVAIVAPLAFLGGMKVEAWRLGEAHQQQLLDLQQNANDRVESALEGLSQAMLRDGWKRMELTTTIKGLNDELEALKAKQVDDARRVGNGTASVRVNATCQAATGPAAGTTTTTPGRTADTAPRLGPAAAADYLDYQRAYAEQLGLLRKCHAYATAVMDKKNAP